MAHLLEVQNLQTHFHTQGKVVKAVDGVSYYLNKGETLAIVGESGCGKSVSALSIMGLVQKPAGRIVNGKVLFEDEDLLELSAENMRKVRGQKISMVFQEPMTSLNPVMTVARQLQETLEAHFPKMDKRASRARALEVMIQVGIPDPDRRLNQYPHQFSGGMRQRVMIAMAMICRPKVILADEPTTALDVTIQAQILDLMRNLSKEADVSMVLITHNLGVVARYADRVNVMYAGKMIEQASAKALYKTPKHPYTLGLLRSVPRLDTAGTARLIPIEGQPPDLSAKMRGCSFLPRCAFGNAQTCGQSTPPLEEVEGGHWVACFKAAQVSHDTLAKNAQALEAQKGAKTGKAKRKK